MYMYILFNFPTIPLPVQNLHNMGVFVEREEIGEDWEERRTEENKQKAILNIKPEKEIVAGNSDLRRQRICTVVGGCSLTSGCKRKNSLEI